MWRCRPKLLFLYFFTDNPFGLRMTCFHCSTLGSEAAGGANVGPIDLISPSPDCGQHSRGVGNLDVYNRLLYALNEWIHCHPDRPTPFSEVMGQKFLEPLTEVHIKIKLLLDPCVMAMAWVQQSGQHKIWSNLRSSHNPF